MRLDTKPGDRVIYEGRNGLPIDRERADAVLERGREYVVRDMNVGGFSSSVYLEGFRTGFNTVMFTNAPEPEVDSGPEM